MKPLLLPLILLTACVTSSPTDVCDEPIADTIAMLGLPIRDTTTTFDSDRQVTTLEWPSRVVVVFLSDNEECLVQQGELP